MKKSFDSEAFLDILLKSGFNLNAAISEFNAPLDIVISMVSTDEFWEKFTKNYPFLKLAVILALYQKIIERPEASAVKEFVRLLTETAANKSDATYFVEFFKPIDEYSDE